MGNHHYGRIFLNVSYYALLVCVLHIRPSLVAGGFGKLLAFLVFFGLLLFVAVHSGEIRRVAVVFFKPLKLPLFSLAVDPSSIARLLTAVALPSKPSLSPLFQRPPPISRG
jgi:hypothetical protein